MLLGPDKWGDTTSISSGLPENFERGRTAELIPECAFFIQTLGLNYAISATLARRSTAICIPDKGERVSYK
jgi:hypothetical protein